MNLFNFLNKRKRGFEKISQEQWIKATGGKSNYEKIKLPKRATKNSAGYDIFSTLEFFLEPNESIVVPTGFKSYMLSDEKISIHPRSGHGFNYFIRLANTTGIGDSDYYNNSNNEGHYFVKIRNEGNKILEVKFGDAIAQCIFEKYLLADGDSFFNGNKRQGGIGSTDKR